LTKTPETPELFTATNEGEDSFDWTLGRRPCRLVARGSKGRAIIEFTDRSRIITPTNELRRTPRGRTK